VSYNKLPPAKSEAEYLKETLQTYLKQGKKIKEVWEHRCSAGIYDVGRILFVDFTDGNVMRILEAPNVESLKKQWEKLKQEINLPTRLNYTIFGKKVWN